MRKYLYAVFVIASLVACSTNTQPQTLIPPATYEATIAHKAAMDKQTYCIAKTIWNEARGESWEGKYAVGSVIMNRVRSSGKTPCEIVSQPGQFASYNVSMSDRKSELFSEIWTIALTAKNESVSIPLVSCSEFFWKSGLMPSSLRGKVVFVKQIGKHSFYRYKDVVCQKAKVEKV